MIPIRMPSAVLLTQKFWRQVLLDLIDRLKCPNSNNYFPFFENVQFVLGEAKTLNQKLAACKEALDIVDLFIGGKELELEHRIRMEQGSSSQTSINNNNYVCGGTHRGVGKMSYADPMLFPEANRTYSARNSICGGSIYSGRSSLCASSARSSISGRSGSLSFRSPSRSSSVSLRLPTHAENLLLPQSCRQSRLSLTSAWESIRGSVLSLSKVSKVFLFNPCLKHRCCLGCVSLRDAVPLICVAELVVMALFTLVAVDLYVTDGKLFYTNELEGKGTMVAIFFAVFIGISVPVIGITLSAWHYQKRQFYLIHIMWQWTILEMLLYSSYYLTTRVINFDSNANTHFLFPSAVVLTIASLFTFLVQCWWLFVFVDAMFYEDAEVNRKTSNISNSSKKGRLYQKRVSHSHSHFDSDSCGTLDSRRPSFNIPIVKLRKPSEDVGLNDRRRSMDTESLPGLRFSSVMEGIPETTIDETAEI